VEFRWGYHCHSLNVFSLDHFLDRMVVVVDFKLIGHLFGALKVCIRNCNQPRLRNQSANVFCVPLSHCAYSNYSHAQLRQEILQLKKGVDQSNQPLATQMGARE
jgi:hypothetical protein